MFIFLYLPCYTPVEVYHNQRQFTILIYTVGKYITTQHFSYISWCFLIDFTLLFYRSIMDDIKKGRSAY